MRMLDYAFERKSFPWILQAYKKMVDAYISEYALAAPIQEACGFQPEQWITQSIEAYCKTHHVDYQQTSSLLTSPVVHSFITEEEIAIYRIALRQKEEKQGKDVASALLKHQRRWFWIQNNYAKFPVLAVDFFQRRVDDLCKASLSELKEKLAHLVARPRSMQEEKMKLFRRYKPDQTLRLYVKINELFSEMQDVRKAFVLRANFYHNRFLSIVAERFRQDMNDLWFYTYWELCDAIRTGHFLDVGNLRARKEIIVEVQSQKEKVVFAGDAAAEFVALLNENVASVTEIKGIIAQTGVIRGRVRIVLKTHDILKVKTGDILVASMTRPEMVAAMKRASAFVTDEGGITCHAAIVAREMNKPCIIGTKIATKVLKDGDVVEVDAERGIVSKIS
ncbi:hypothetical protein HY624_01885 [Candidatus Uhrbacteria bacterium]|nr:hypothetical protein [Candidatus Uhrbacteria bacterium]